MPLANPTLDGICITIKVAAVVVKSELKFGGGSANFLSNHLWEIGTNIMAPQNDCQVANGGDDQLGHLLDTKEVCTPPPSYHAQLPT